MNALPTTRVHERLFVAELDSLRQALRWNAAEDRQEALRDLLSILRVADLLSKTVVLTDAQLLDGVGLLALGPDRVSAAGSG